MPWVTILVTAFLSSLFTLVVGALVARLWILPELERHLDRKADEAAARIEQQLKQRIAQGFTELVGTLHGVVRDQAATAVRTTADIVGEGVRRVVEKIGPGRGIGGTPGDGR